MFTWERNLIDITIRHDRGRTKNDEVRLRQDITGPIRQMIANAFHLSLESVSIATEARTGNWTMPKLSIELCVAGDEAWKCLNQSALTRLKARLVQVVSQALPLRDEEMELAIFKA